MVLERATIIPTGDRMGRATIYNIGSAVISEYADGSQFATGVDFTTIFNQTVAAFRSVRVLQKDDGTAYTCNKVAGQFYALNLHSYLDLEIEPGTTFKKNATDQYVLCLAKDVSFITVRGGVFDGNGTINSTQGYPTFRVEGDCTDILVECAIAQNLEAGGDNYGFDVKFSATAAPKRITFRKCIAQDTGDDGFSCVGSTADSQFPSDITYEDCYSEDIGFAKVTRTVADAVTNGTSTVTSATAAFVAADVGRYCQVKNGATYLTALGTTILSVAGDGLSCVLSGSGGAGGAGRTIIIGADMQNANGLEIEDGPQRVAVRNWRAKNCASSGFVVDGGDAGTTHTCPKQIDVDGIWIDQTGTVNTSGTTIRGIRWTASGSADANSKSIMRGLHVIDVPAGLGAGLLINAIRGLTILGVDISVSCAYGIQFDKVASSLNAPGDIVISGGSVTGGTSGQVYTDDTDKNVIIENLRVTGTTTGFNSPATSTGVHYKGCYASVSGAATDGWTILASQVKLSNCVAELCGRRGFNVNTTFDVRFSDCTAIDNAGEGFLAGNAADRTVFMNCEAYDTRSAGARTQTYGVRIHGGTTPPNSCQVQGGNYRNNTTNDIGIGTVGTGHRIVTGLVVAKTGAYTATVADGTVAHTSGGGGAAVTLPLASQGIAGQRVTVIKVDNGAGATTPTANVADSITGPGAIAVATWPLATQGDYATFETDGANSWRVVA